MVGAAVLLLTLVVAEFCSAAEVTFGPGGKYSLELPANWTAKAGKSNAVSGNSGGVSFSGNAFPTKDSPEGLMEKAIAGNLKEAGYKSIEKGIFTSAAGRKAYLNRYQIEGKSGPYVLVEYYFQLVEKEVVVLLFEFPSNIPKSPKSDIEAIFNSVKVTTAAAQDDSWLTAPDDKSKATGAGDSQIAGKYVSSRQSSDYIILKADGTFSGEVQGESHKGTYTRNGATITFKFSETVTEDLKLEKDALVDKKGYRWVKKP